MMTIEKGNQLFEAINSLLEKYNGKNKFIVDKDLYNEIENHKIFKNANLDEFNKKELIARLSVFAIHEKNSRLFDCIFGKDIKKNYEIINEIYKINYLTPTIFEYILRKKNNWIYISSQLIKSFIQNNQFDLSDILFKYSKFYDNKIILEFCCYYKYKKPMSSEELQNKISDEKYIIESNKYEISDEIKKDFTIYERYYYSYLRGNYLSHACKKGHEFIIKFLVQHGADVNKNVNVRARYIYDGNNNYNKDENENEDEDEDEDEDEEEEEDEDNEYEYYYKMKEFGNDGYWDIYEASAYGYYEAYTDSVDYDIPLIAACSNGNEAIVKYLVEHGADVNQSSKFSTPLVTACKNGNVDLIKYLVVQGANVNQKGWQDSANLGMKTKAVWDGNTPLIEACKNGNEYLVKYLVEQGANINVVNNYGVSPLALVCKNENEALVKYLVEHGADVNQKGWQDSANFRMRYNNVNCDSTMTPLIIACGKGNETIIKYLVEHGADVNQKYKYHYKTNFNVIFHYYITPLVAACKSRNEVVVSYLVENGANVDPEDVDSEDAIQKSINIYFFTPLVTSCKYGNETIVNYLVEKGADIHRKSPIYEENNSEITEIFYTPLEMAIKNKNEVIEKYLKYIMDKCNPNINQTSKYNESLIEACKNGNESIVRDSVEHHGANVNYIGTYPKVDKEPENDKDFYDDEDDNDIPLLAACVHGNESIVKYLVDHGADVHLNGKYNTPLAAACMNGNESLVIYLIEHGAPIDNDDNINSLSPLVAACINGNEFIVKYLVEHGADINRKGRRKHRTRRNDKHGEAIDYLSPLVTACEYEHETIIKYLTEHGANVNIIDKYFTFSENSLGQTPLRAVCEHGNESLVKYLVEKGALIDFPIRNSECKNPTSDYFTPLIMACRHGNESVVKYLVENGADVNLKVSRFHNIRNDYYYETPLVAASKNGNESIVKYLVEHEANVKGYNGTYPYRYKKPEVDDRNYCYYVPLIAAYKNGNEAIVNYLLEHGANISQISEYNKSSPEEKEKEKQEEETASDTNGNVKTPLLDNLKDHCRNVDLLDDLDYTNYFGECLTPLIIACKYGNETIVKLLVENGANVNQVGLRKYRKNFDYYEETALVTACFYGKEAIVKYLVDHGADINQKYRIKCKKNY